MILMFTGPIALGYETDQLTERDRPLSDAAPYADARMDEVIARAVARTNEALRCEGDEDDTRAELAKDIEHIAGRATLLRGRGLSHAFGYSAYEILLESDPVDRLTFSGHGDDVFGDVRLLDSPILAGAGICSTIELAGVRMGTDKIAHFFVEGYDAWRAAQRREDPGAAEAFSTRTERTVLGWWTSDTFSYADIAADLSGYAFYDGLLRPGSVATLGAGGCAEVARPWAWSEHVDDRWDEVLNPSVYRPAVQRRIDQWLDEHQDEVCDAFSRWAAASYGDRVARAIAARPTYTTDAAIDGPDPFRLLDRCVLRTADAGR